MAAVDDQNDDVNISNTSATSNRRTGPHHVVSIWESHIRIISIIIGIGLLLYLLYIVLIIPIPDEEIYLITGCTSMVILFLSIGLSHKVYYYLCFRWTITPSMRLQNEKEESNSKLR